LAGINTHPFRGHCILFAPGADTHPEQPGTCERDRGLERPSLFRVPPVVAHADFSHQRDLQLVDVFHFVPH
jgi:hypothetical protein